MHDLVETRKKLISSLGADLSERYFLLFRSWFKFKSELTQIQFHFSALKLLKTDEQRDLHHAFFNAVLSKVSTQQKQPLNPVFMAADPMDYIPNAAPGQPPQHDNRSASLEFFLPDAKFMATKIDIHAWENGLSGAEEDVAPYLVHACQVFVKNIITAMISRKRSYKIREGNFQHAFGFPVPDREIHNSANIIDHSQEPKTTLLPDELAFPPNVRSSSELNAEAPNTAMDQSQELKPATLQEELAFTPSYRPNEKPGAKPENAADPEQKAVELTFGPTYRPNLERIEQQTAFAYACGKRGPPTDKLTVKLLYETLRDNPNITGMHSINSVQMLKVGLHLED